MHRAAGDVAAKAEGAGFVGNKGQGCTLSGVGFDGNAVAIHIETVNNICADQLDGYGVAGVDVKLGGRIGKLVRINLKGPFSSD